MNHISATHRRIAGFTLVEMAMVLFIVALLLGGLLPTISSQVEQRQTNETRKQLDEIQQALIGFAVNNGRFPCPASSTSNGQESFCTSATGACSPTTTTQSHGKCSNFYDGFVPSSTLGLTTTSSTGFADDAWGNHIHYAVTLAGPNAFTTPNGINMTVLSSSASELFVCSTATGITGSSPYCASGAALTSAPGVPVVIYSIGKNGGYGGTGTDESRNPNPNTSLTPDRIFVSHTPTSIGSPNGEFDDIVIWISPNILVNRMVAAGKLP